MIFSKVLYSHFLLQVINEQHGFVKGRSTCTNLCEFSQIVLNSLANRMQVDIIYTDMTKAFDIVDHEILVCKLSRLGLCQSLLDLFRSFFSNRY